MGVGSSLRRGSGGIPVSCHVALRLGLQGGSGGLEEGGPVLSLRRECSWFTDISKIKLSRKAPWSLLVKRLLSYES